MRFFSDLIYTHTMSITSSFNISTIVGFIIRLQENLVEFVGNGIIIPSDPFSNMLLHNEWIHQYQNGCENLILFTQIIFSFQQQSSPLKNASNITRLEKSHRPLPIINF